MKCVWLLCLLLALPVRAEETTLPRGFVLQKLTACGQSMARPADWFCLETPTNSGRLWTISKEDPSQGDYRTGYRIQFITNVREATGKSMAEFGDLFLQSKGNARILRTVPVTKVGPFQCRGIEVTQMINDSGKTTLYHLIYLYYWSEERNMALVTTSGAPDELWSQYEKTFSIMQNFTPLESKKLYDDALLPSGAK